MEITDEKKLKDIQRDFRTQFQNLKIEFYRGHHAAGEGSPDKEHLDPEKTLGEVRKIHNEGEFRVHPNLKVSTFEQDFFSKYGLNVQVFRKSGNLWIQTTSTDSWTLAEQNRKGGASEQYLREMYE